MDVKTRLIIPHPLLQKFIRYYGIRTFDTEDQEFLKAMTADNEMTICFCLNSRLFNYQSLVENINHYKVKADAGPQCCFIGIQTSTKGFAVFKGPTSLLVVHFKPLGFINIFNISPKETLDQIGDCEEIFGNEMSLVHEQMNDTLDLLQCVNILETYLIQKLSDSKSKHKNSPLIYAADFLIKKSGFYSIKTLASHSNMTLQTFEVKFTDQIGVAPKQFSRLVRFTLAITIKLYQPEKTWTQIAMSMGYHDQNHFIKEFKSFSNLTPKDFLKEIKPPLEKFQ